MLPFLFVSANIELFRELVISKMHSKFGKDTRTTFQFIVHTLNISADADADTNDAEIQLQWPTFSNCKLNAGEKD